MRVGRLRSSTLANILRSIEAQDEFNSNDPFPALTKQYIPSNADSPLFRLITILHTGRSIPDIQQQAEASISTTPRDTVNAPSSSATHQHPSILDQEISIRDNQESQLPSQTASRSQFLEIRSETDLQQPRTIFRRGSQAQAVVSAPYEAETNRTTSLPNVLQTVRQRSLDSMPPRPGAPLPPILPLPLAQTPLRHSTVSISSDLAHEMDMSLARGTSALSMSSSSSVSPNNTSRNGRFDDIAEDETKSPSEIARSATIPSLKPNIPDNLSPDHANEPSSWTKDYSHIDIEWSMQAMDVLYNASFYDYIRDEKNVDLASIRLARVVKDYKPRQVAVALRWMIQGWSIESSAKLLRVVFSDWLPDLAGCVFALLSRDWPRKPQVSLCCAYLLIAEPPTVSALFLRSLTGTWGKESITDLIGYLDHILEWDEEYFRELMSIYSELIRADLKRISTSDSEPSSPYSSLQKETDGDKMLQYLATLYKKSMAMTTYKMALADARLALAEYNLQVCQHLMGCETCQKNETCKELAELTPPEIPSLPNITSDDENVLETSSSWEDLPENEYEDASNTSSSKSFSEAAIKNSDSYCKHIGTNLDEEPSQIIHYSDLSSCVELANAAQLAALLSTGTSVIPMTSSDNQSAGPLFSHQVPFNPSTLSRTNSKEALNTSFRGPTASDSQ